MQYFDIKISVNLSWLISRYAKFMYCQFCFIAADLKLKYYWGLDIKNLLRQSIMVYWMEGKFKKSMLVKGYGSQHYDAVITSQSQPSNINVTAYPQKSGELVQIYSKYFTMITPMRERGRTVLVIGKLG